MRLLSEIEERGQVEGIVCERGAPVHRVQVVSYVRLVVEIVADRGAGPVPRAPEEGFVLGLQRLRLVSGVEERVVAVVVQAAVVLGRVRVGLVRGAALEFRVGREVVEGRHTVPVAPAERAEGGFFVWVDGHVDALAFGIHVA